MILFIYLFIFERRGGEGCREGSSQFDSFIDDQWAVDQSMCLLFAKDLNEIEIFFHTEVGFVLAFRLCWLLDVHKRKRTWMCLYEVRLSSPLSPSSHSLHLLCLFVCMCVQVCVCVLLIFTFRSVSVCLSLVYLHPGSDFFFVLSFFRFVCVLRQFNFLSNCTL